MTTGTIKSSETVYPYNVGTFAGIIQIDILLRQLHRIKERYGGKAFISFDSNLVPSIRARSADDTQNIPANTTAPRAASAALTTGSVLQCGTGVWSGSPTSFTYSWTSDGVVVGTSPTYTLVGGDSGHAMICTVTAINAYGSASQASNTLTAA